ncbi:MAG: acetylxylan esterase [Lentisphaeria bacterium]|nr:acetylxylan esterase [Lentisphaeria bacterium]
MSDRFIYSSMLQEYNVGRIRQLNLERDTRISRLATKADAENYCMEVRSKISSCFQLPERIGVPEVRITGKFDFPESRVEKIIYESRPGFPVTALLFLPKVLREAAPAVLFLCGHSQLGKNEPAYQMCCRTLAKSGFVVLCVDPAGQGERYQFTGNINAVDVAGVCTREHNMLGKQMSLCGDFFGTWRAHDALCGLDYLLSRPEVDISRVGVTGNSGGGTMTTFVQALEPRFTMAAPSCYVTSWKRNIENELPADVEQLPPGIWESGCEMGDFVLAYAPRPLILMGQKKDFFDPRGLQETYEQCRRVYALLGAEDNLRCFIGPDPHGYTLANRKSMYSFFGEIADMPIAECEAENIVLPPDALNCTPSGQVSFMPEYKGVHDFITEKVDALAVSRKKLDFAELRRTVAVHLGINSNVPVPYSRFLRPACNNAGTVREQIMVRIGLETEPGILTILKVPVQQDAYFFPETEKMTLYVPHQDSAEELQNILWDDTIIAGVDVRGIGETMPLTCDRYENDFFAHYGREYHYNGCSLMLGSSLLAERIRDLLGAVAFVKSKGVRDIRLAGRGIGAVIAVLTALISDDISSCELFAAPESWSSMAKSRITLWPQSVMPKGILKITDLNEIYDILSGKMPFEIHSYMDNYLKKSLQ